MQSPGDFAGFVNYNLANGLSFMPGCKQALWSKMGFYFRLLLTDAISNIIEYITIFMPRINKNLQLYGLSNIFQYVS